MKYSRKFTAIVLMFVLCLTLAACTGNSPASTGGGATSTTPTGGGSASPSPTATDRQDVLVPGDLIEAPKGEDVKYADMITISIGDNIAVIDPFAQGAVSSVYLNIYTMIFDNLVYRTPDGDFVPQLATSWETNDMQTYIFHLRDDVYFHNRDKFTSQDVVNTFLLASDPSAAGAQADAIWRHVKSVTAIDEYTVEIVTTQVNSEFLYHLTVPGGGIINKAAREADPIRGSWVGTGAFYVSDFVSGDYVDVTRNDDYWGTLPITRVVRMRLIPEMAARTIMQLNNETQMSVVISPNDLDMFADHPDHVVYGFASNANHCLFFNLNHPIFSDRNFRMAVAHCVDRAEMAIAAGGNWMIPTQDGSWWGDTTPYRNTDLPLIPYDLDKAKEYLALSQYKGEELEIMTAPDALTISSQVLAEQLGRIGIKTRVFSTDIATLIGRSQYGSTSMEMLHFVAPFSLNASSARFMFYTGQGANRSSYSNAEVDRLLDLALEVPMDEQEAIYKKVQEIVYEDIPGLGLYERIQTIVTHKNLGGIIINADMYHDFRGIFMTLDD